MVDEVQSKHCRKCDTTKPVTEFYARRKTGGYQPKCKACETAYRIANRERILARNKDFYQKNKHKWQEYHKHRYANKSDEMKQRVADWRKANPERTKQTYDAWRAANLDRFNENARRRTARKRGNGVYKTAKNEIRRLYQQPCLYCGSRENITLDHVIPLARGGTHSIGNLVPACRPCNVSKHTKTIMEWRVWKMRKAPH